MPTDDHEVGYRRPPVATSVPAAVISLPSGHRDSVPYREIPEFSRVVIETTGLASKSATAPSVFSPKPAPAIGKISRIVELSLSNDGCGPLYTCRVQDTWTA